MRETQPEAAPRSEAGGPPSIWFLGDLTDPRVNALADALPRETHRISCPAELPDTPFGPGPEVRPGVLVLHRPVLTRHDFERLRRWRSVVSPVPRVVLCHGPHVRYADLGRWAELVDVMLPEATAVEVVARQVDDALAGRDQPAIVLPPTRNRPHVAIVSTNSALRFALAEACESVGFPVTAAQDWEELRGTGVGLAVWDVPVLEVDWLREMERQARLRGVVALLGFADRRMVDEALAAGARACLDLPADLADLFQVLDRLAFQVRAEPGHDLPPAPVVRRRPAANARTLAEGSNEP